MMPGLETAKLMGPPKKLQNLPIGSSITILEYILAQSIPIQG
jgi:hypothetical protein